MKIPRKAYLRGKRSYDNAMQHWSGSVPPFKTLPRYWQRWWAKTDEQLEKEAIAQGLMRRPPEKVPSVVPSRCMVYKFYRHDVLRHVKSGKVYIILETPEFYRLESTGQPAYAYRRKDARLITDYRVWIRSQTEVEDGRFEVLS